MSPRVAPARGRPAAIEVAPFLSFVRRYRSEMSRPEASRVLDLLAALSRTTDFSVGCYCQDERRCHRSVLRELLVEHGATLVEGESEGKASG